LQRDFFPGKRLRDMTSERWELVAPISCVLAAVIGKPGESLRDPYCHCDIDRETVDG
jgi:hypothetical protein